MGKINNILIILICISILLAGSVNAVTWTRAGSGNGSITNNYYNVSGGGNMSYQVDNFNVTNELRAGNISVDYMNITGELNVSMGLIETQDLSVTNVFGTNGIYSRGITIQNAPYGAFSEGMSSITFSTTPWSGYADNAFLIYVLNDSTGATYGDYQMGIRSLSFLGDGSSNGVNISSYQDSTFAEKSNITFVADIVDLSTNVNRILLGAVSSLTATTANILNLNFTNANRAININGTQSNYTNAKITALTIPYSTIPAHTASLNGTWRHNLTGEYRANKTGWFLAYVD